MLGRGGAGDPDLHIFRTRRSTEGGAGPRPLEDEHERWPPSSSSSCPSRRRYEEEDNDEPH